MPSKFTGLARPLGRLSRWLFFGVVLSAAPLVVSFVFLPANETVSGFLAEGDLAILAAAFSGAAMGELLGPVEPPKWFRNLVIACLITLLLGSFVLLAMITGNSPHGTEEQKLDWSEKLLLSSIVVGGATMVMTTERPGREHGSDVSGEDALDAVKDNQHGGDHG